MINKLDIRTLSLIYGIITLVLCICMVYIYTYRKTYRGFKYWAIGSVGNALGMILIGFRGFLPDYITIVLANVIIVIGVCITTCGLEIFVGLNRRLWLYILSVVPSIFLFTYFTYFTPDTNARIIVSSSILAVLFFYSGYITKNKFDRVMGEKSIFLPMIFFGQTAWLIIRSVVSFLSDMNIYDFMKVSGIQSISFIIFIIVQIFVIFCLIIVNFQRVEQDLKASTEEIKTLKGIIPICMNCKKIRNDEGLWDKFEIYIRDHSDADFSHGFCPECFKEYYDKELD